jgi:hypothetical protein
MRPMVVLMVAEWQYKHSQFVLPMIAVAPRLTARGAVFCGGALGPGSIHAMGSDCVLCGVFPCMVIKISLTIADKLLDSRLCNL